jgi:glycosyltransferase 2 family protein
MTGLRLSRRGRIALFAVGCLISAVAVVVALRGVDLQAAARVLSSAQPAWLAAAVATLAVQTVIRAERWRRLLPVGERPRPRLRRIVPPLLVGYLGNTVLPARLGEPIRAGLVAGREDLPLSGTLGSVVLERVIDTVALATVGAVAVVGLIGSGLSPAIGIPVVIAFAIGLVGIAVLAVAPDLVHTLRIDRLPRIGGFLFALSRGASVAGQGRAAWIALGLSVVAWLLDATIYWCVGRALDVDLPIQSAIVVSVAAALSTAIPAAPGYIGTYEVAITTTLGLLGVDPATALAFAICVHAVIVIPIVLAGGASAIAIARPGATAASPEGADQPASDAAGEAA